MDNVEYIASIYSTSYYIVLLILSCYAYLSYSRKNNFLNVGIAVPLAIAIVIFLAFRPLTYKYGFGDTQGYAFFFELKKKAQDFNISASDIGYELITYLLLDCDVWVLFMAMGALYVIPQLITSRLLTPAHYGILFLIIVCSFSFWGYGVNGMRNGVALSLVMLGMVRQNIIWTPILFLCGLSFHASSLLPICAYCLNFVYRKSGIYVTVWCVCVVLSLFVSNMLTEVLPIQNWIQDGRVGYLSQGFDDANSGKFSSTGYRWDFLLYSAIPIILGYKQISSGAIKDKVYKYLFNTYCTCNAFWLFTIYIPFNNRFAYLSWFLYPIIVSCPFLQKDKILTESSVKSIRNVIGLTYLFTFIMWLK